MRASYFYSKHQKYFTCRKLKCCLQSPHFNRWAVCSTEEGKEGNELYQRINHSVRVASCSATNRAPHNRHIAPAQVLEYSVFFRTNLSLFLGNDSVGKRITRNFCASVVNNFHAQRRTYSPALSAPT